VKKLIGILLAVSLLMACGSSRQVSRIAADTTIDLSGRWNDTDARLVSEEMISDCLSRAWVNDFNTLIPKHSPRISNVSLLIRAK